jgi:hypothetical protein
MNFLSDQDLEFIQNMDQSLNHLKNLPMSRYQCRKIYNGITPKEADTLLCINREWAKKNVLPDYKQYVSDLRSRYKDCLKQKYAVDKERFKKYQPKNDLNINNTMKRYPLLTREEVTEMQKINFEIRKEKDKDYKSLLRDQRDEYISLQREREFAIKHSKPDFKKIDKQKILDNEIKNNTTTRDIKQYGLTESNEEEPEFDDGIPDENED